MKCVTLNKHHPGIRQLIINEAGLLNYLNSDKIVKCVDIFEYKNNILMFEEYMDYLSQEKIIIEGRNSRLYSERFC